MPATSDQEVFNFEGNLENSFYQFLEENGIELATANDPQRLGDDYISVEIKMFGLNIDEHMSEKPNGHLEYDHYDYQAIITVHTDRNDNSIPSLEFKRKHQELICNIRYLLSISRAAETASLNDKIDFYWINRLVPSGTDYLATELGYDETTLSYDGDFSILTTAWSVD